MKNRLPDFYKQHAEYQSLIGLYLLAWEEEFHGEIGKELTADIAESEEESQAQYKYYTGQGYVLRDENLFGNSNGETYRISCYAKRQST